MAKPTISIFSAKRGHLSIAQAIQEVVNPHFHTFLNLPKKDILPSYLPIYRFFPKVNKLNFNLSKKTGIQKLLNTYSQLTLQDSVVSNLKNQKPNIVISTHLFYNHLLQLLNTHNNYHFINILTDPRSISPAITAPKAHNLVFDKKTKKTCQKLGIPSQNILESGWFVRNKFQQPYQKQSVRKKLGLNPQTLTFTIVSGSEGTNYILKILPSLTTIHQPLQLIFLCGRNTSLFKTTKALSKALQSTNKNISAQSHNFTQNIHLFLQAADLTIGKAGPNLIFESVATHTPFLATTHISGQEDGNLEIIKKYQIGFVEENILRLPSLLKSILKNPQKLEKLEKPLQKLAGKNQKSQQILLNLIQKFLESQT